MQTDIVSTINGDYKRELPNGVIVHRYKVIGTFRWNYCAYEPGTPWSTHATWTTFGTSVWYGSVMSRRIPQEIEAMKAGSPERLAACAAWSVERRRDALAAIHAAFPETKGGRQDNTTGDVEL